VGSIIQIGPEFREPGHILIELIRKRPSIKMYMGYLGICPIYARGRRAMRLTVRGYAGETESRGIGA
jgi:hypothetical protein